MIHIIDSYCIKYKEINICHSEIYKNKFPMKFFLNNKNISCTAGKKNQTKNTPIYFNTSYRTEMKLVPHIMDYCLLQFDAFLRGLSTLGVST